jgi:hypothetical protein
MTILCRKRIAINSCWPLVVTMLYRAAEMITSPPAGTRHFGLRSAQPRGVTWPIPTMTANKNRGLPIASVRMPAL